MRFRTFLIINAILAVIIGALLVLIPSILIRYFGLAPDSGMDVDGALFGSMLILMGLVAWFSRDVTDAKAQMALVEAYTIASLISLVVSVVALVNHTFNAVGWVVVALYAIATVVYGYYWYRLPRERVEMRPIEQHSEAMH